MMKKTLFFVFLLAGINGMAQTVERYVSTNGTHQPPFTNWIMAATNLKTAVDWANTNNAQDTVWVSNGLHRLTAEIVVSNTIVRGFSGQREEVVIDGAGNYRCFRLNHPNAKLQALTVSNGYSSLSTFMGGGINLYTGQVVDVVVGWCYALYNGGGIYFNGPGLVTGCQVTANTGARGGGGIYMSSACTMSTVSCSQVIGNITTNTTAGYGGGGICVQKGVIEHCLIASNQTVFRSGGGICFYTGGGVLRDSTIIDNQTIGSVSGGGIGSYTPDTVEISGCLIRDNTAQSHGGGLYYVSVNATCRVWNCTIESNRTPAASGGGIYFSGLNASISNSFVRGNLALNGSAAWMQCGATMRSCLIVGNTLGIGALYLQNTSTVENCTVVGNSAASSGGLRMATTNAQIIRNCVIYNNWNTNGTRQDVSLVTDGENYFFNSCVGTMVLPLSQGNITNNPLFMAVDDYRLQAGSPCINAGTNLDWMTGAFDLDGRLRQDRFSGKVDMGAYEFVPNGMLFIGK